MHKDTLQFPFRLGTTSYIIPADIIPNVMLLAGKIDDIELVLFESETISNLPDDAVIRTLRMLAEEHGLTYTVHFPLDISLCDRDEKRRIASVAQCQRIIDLFRPIDPFAYIVHCNEDSGALNSPADDLENWVRQARQSFGELAGMVDDPRVFAIETLQYPFHVLDEPVREHNMSVCLDIGHLIMNGFSLARHYDTYWDITRVVHLHGIIDGKDHASLAGLDETVLSQLLALLKATSGTERVLTLELFSESDFNDSYDILRNYTDD